MTLRVFDLETGVERLRAPVGQAVLGLGFTPDSQAVEVMAGSTVAEILTFPLDIQQWVNMGCERVQGNFTPEQWLIYLPGVDYHKTCAVLNPIKAPLQSN